MGSVILEAGLPLALATIMFVLGLSLTPADFARVLRAPRGVAIGMANLLVVSPLLAIGVAALWDLPPVLAAGLVLLGASPGGTMANLLTHLARGETALSVTMTALSSVLAVVTVPLWLGVGIDVFDARGLDGDVEIAGIAVLVFLITVVPLSIGMAVRHRRPERTVELEPKLKRAALTLFVVVVAAAIASEAGDVADEIGGLIGAVLTLNVAAMALSFATATVAGLGPRQSTAIAMELGVHNSTVAIAVATTIDTELAVPGAVYGITMFFTAAAFARVMASRNARAAAQLTPQD